MDLLQMKEAAKQIPGKGGKVVRDLVDEAMRLRTCLDEKLSVCKPHCDEIKRLDGVIKELREQVEQLEPFSDNEMYS